MTTVLEVCLDATHHIWDDREAYILAVLETVHIDPDADYETLSHPTPTMEHS